MQKKVTIFDLRTILIFVNAFLVSRLLAVSNVANLSVLWLLNLCGSRISILVFFLLLSSAGLSLFMPNVITVLTLLPALKILNEKLQPVLKEYTATVLALAAPTGSRSSRVRNHPTQFHTRYSLSRAPEIYAPIK